MKQNPYVLRYFALIALLLMTVIVVVSCTTTEPPSVSDSDSNAPESSAEESSSDVTTDAGTTEEVATEIQLVKDGKSEYVVIVPEECDDRVMQAANMVIDAVKNATGVTLTMKIDLLSNSLGYKESPYEIIVGPCNRDASKTVRKELRANDYSVQVSGTQLVIVGGSDAATYRAAQAFASNVITPDTVFPKEVLTSFTDQYRISELKLNGYDLREYQIVYKSNKATVYKDAAYRLRDLFVAYCGVSLDVVTSKTDASPCEILFGDCGRSGVGKLSLDDVYSYAIAATSQADGAKISFESSNALVMQKVIETWFASTFEAEATGSVQASVSTDVLKDQVSFGKPLTEGAELRIMTNNILGGDLERASLLLDVFTTYFPDIIGLQECGGDGHQYVVKPLEDFYGVACRYIGKTDKKCHTPILYRKDLYELVAEESFFYDSRWPKTNTKTLSWALLKHKATGKTFAVINTHYAIVSDSYDTESEFGYKYSNSVEGVLWRNDNSRQVLETVVSLREKHGADIPIFFMGDLNCNVASDALKAVEEVLDNSHDVATVSRSDGYASWHSVGQMPTVNGTPIDHIYVSTGNVTVFTHEIPFTDRTVLASTDHCPVICDVALP